MSQGTLLTRNFVKYTEIAVLGLKFRCCVIAEHVPPIFDLGFESSVIS